MARPQVPSFPTVSSRNGQVEPSSLSAYARAVLDWAHTVRRSLEDLEDIDGGTP